MAWWWKNTRILLAGGLWLLLSVPAWSDSAPASAPARRPNAYVFPGGIQFALPLDPTATPVRKPVQKPVQANFSNYITQATTQSGVYACAARITQVTNFLVPPPKLAGALMMTVFEDRDEQLVPLLLESETGSGPAFFSASFAPHQSNGCGATYDAVRYWPERCEVVAEQQFGTLRKAGMLHKEIRMLDGGSATKVFLMPAGEGCVSIKKEVVL